VARAVDIMDSDILDAINHRRWTNWPVTDSPRHPADGPRWVMIGELEERFPAVHPKVLRAKLNAMHRRGVIDGCMCGCRGDLEINKNLATAYRPEVP